MVGPRRFELLTPSPPAKCATRLRYGPNQKESRKVCLHSSLRVKLNKVE